MMSCSIFVRQLDFVHQLLEDYQWPEAGNIKGVTLVVFHGTVGSILVQLIFTCIGLSLLTLVPSQPRQNLRFSRTGISALGLPGSVAFLLNTLARPLVLRTPVNLSRPPRCLLFYFSWCCRMPIASLVALLCPPGDTVAVFVHPGAPRTSRDIARVCLRRTKDSRGA